MSGMFITFEGIEGCGKSTQAQRLRTALEASGYLVCLTREPGGTVISEAIRGILLNPDHSAMKPTTELLLYQAARAQHVEEVIRPALEADKIVVCDRFVDSTLAYQGAGRDLPKDVLDAALDARLISHCTPDLTLLLDIEVETGLERSRREREWDRIERESLAFHQRVRKGFLDIAAREPKRVRVIDARGSADAIESAIREVVDAALAERSLRQATP